MKELAKRWARVALKSGKTMWVLKEKDAKWNWAFARHDSVKGGWWLQIWDDGDWGKPIDIPTLRAAKALGRLLATAATR